MNNMFNSRDIFAISEGALSIPNGLELRYESRKHSGPDYIREQVWGDKMGSYYMSVKCGKKASYFRGLSYDFAGREISFPATKEALALWAEMSLSGSKLEDARKEFRRKCKLLEKVWGYQQGADDTQPGFIYEYLRKTNKDNTYALFSSDSSYPCFSQSVLCNNRSQSMPSYLNLYHVTADTAQRWAKARGIDPYTFKEVFGYEM